MTSSQIGHYLFSDYLSGINFNLLSNTKVVSYGYPVTECNEKYILNTPTLLNHYIEERLSAIYCNLHR